MNKKVLILLCLFILSRVLFINPLPVFFDSPEYLARLSNPNYFKAITSGHLPFHAGYILLFWPIFHIFTLFGANPSFAVILVQIIFSAIAIYCFYRFVGIMTNKKIAIIAAAVGISVPIYWIANATIMAESAFVNFFLISLFFLAAYVKNKAHLNIYLLIGCVSFGLSIFTNPLVILWSPFLLSVAYFLRKEKTMIISLSIILTIALAVLANSFLIQNGIRQYLFGEDVKVLPNISSFLTILRFVRNALIPILQNNTAIICILSLISLIKIFNKNRKLFVIAFLWISPAIITSQWYDPLLFGRHGIIAGFGLAFLTAIFLEKRKRLFPLVISYLLLVSLPALALLREPVPYLETSRFVKTLPKGLLIETHFARPQIEGDYLGEIIFVNQPGWSKEKLEKTIDSYLNSKKPIFITSQALSDPYGVYSGPFLYSLSLSYAKKFELEDILSSYLIKEYATINKDAGIAIYKIVSKEKSPYPMIPKLKYNRHRIDYFDPISQLRFFIERAITTQSQNIIKE